MADRLSYADALKEKMAHAPVAPTSSSAERERVEAQEGEAIEPEFVAAVTNMGRNAEFHPTIATPGEQLPEGYSRSCAGFLLCNTLSEVKVDQEVVRKESERLQKHAIVAYFVGGRQTNAVLTQWVAALQTQTSDWVGLGRDLGKGFFQILTKQAATTQKLLMLTPHRTRWGTSILQTWASGFDSSKPSRLKVPTWVTLRGIPGEFLGVAKDIAAGLGELLGSDKRNACTADQRFCVALQSGQGWKTQLAVHNDITGEKVVILVDYCNLPIRCRCCHSTEHLIKDCPSIKSTPPVGDTSETPVEDRSSAAVSGQSAGGLNVDSGGNPLPPPPPRTEPAPNGGPVNSVDSLMGVNSEPSTDFSGNHYENGEERLTPEYEWNGWEKVPRHKHSQRDRAPGDPPRRNKYSERILGYQRPENRRPEPGQAQGLDPQPSAEVHPSQSGLRAEGRIVQGHHRGRPANRSGRSSEGATPRNQGEQRDHRGGETGRRPTRRPDPTNVEWETGQRTIAVEAPAVPAVVEGTGAESGRRQEDPTAGQENSGDKMNRRYNQGVLAILRREAADDTLIMDENDALILAALEAAETRHNAGGTQPPQPEGVAPSRATLEPHSNGGRHHSMPPPG